MEATPETLDSNQPYSEELGIGLSSGTDGELFRWFLARIPFGARPVVNGGSAEGAILRQVWIPCVPTGFANPGASLDAPDENIHIDTYIQGVRYAAAIMEHFGRGGGPSARRSRLLVRPGYPVGPRRAFSHPRGNSRCGSAR